MTHTHTAETSKYIFKVKNKKCKSVLYKYNFYLSIGTFYINSKLHIRNKISIKTIYSTIFFVSLFLRKTIDYIIGTHKCTWMFSREEILTIVSLLSVDSVLVTPQSKVHSICIAYTSIYVFLQHIFFLRFWFFLCIWKLLKFVWWNVFSLINWVLSNLCFILLCI